MVVELLDKKFTSFITKEEIDKEISNLAESINNNYAGKEVVFIAVLNGAFIFAADLYRKITVSSSISFIKVQSYEGMQSTGSVHEVIGLTTDIASKHVLIVEDIVDTGITIEKVKTLLNLQKPASVEVCSLLFKPEAFEGKEIPKFIGFSIPKRFVVGYGLDYNEKGRNLDEIYQLKEQNCSQNTMLNIVLFGPPGAGKGTQSERLIEKYGLKHLSTGDIFRYNMSNDTELGKLAKSYIDKGQLVPDEVTIQMLKDQVLQNQEAKGFIFDGFPRTNAQAEALDQLLKELSTEISVMLALEVEENELKNRLKKRAEVSGRADDADPKVIANRIQVYKNETEPVKAFYQKQNKFIGIDGIGTIDEISMRLNEAIASI
ncbi:MAG: adenylate kinase [Bacteroidetes bacterium]|nr:adenylate kinase [Bacteroidota bacterium]